MSEETPAKATQDITTIPTAELRADKRAARARIRTCEAALKMGITHYRDGFAVQEWIHIDQIIIAKIQVELSRRQDI